MVYGIMRESNEFERLTQVFDGDAMYNQKIRWNLISKVQDKLTEKKTEGKTYEYECLRCGLTLTFKRNQTDVKCPNDGSRMYKV
jgi:DNA-directed RNA polymerase subunit RPC12/RpoP